MICPKCGGEVGSGAKFCEGCGSKLDVPKEEVSGPPKSLPGKFHRLFLVVLMMWTALMAGLVMASSVTVGNPQAHPGAVLGWTLGAGIAGIVWGIGAGILAVLAIATKPSPSVRWPLSTTLGSVAVTVVVFLWSISAGFHATVPGQTATEPSGSGITAQPADGWRVSRTVSAMDGSKTITLTLDSENEIQAWLGQKKPSLLIRCKEGKAEVYINMGTAASVETAEDTHTVRLRFDQSGPVTQHWSESTEQEALFSPEAKELTTQLVTANALAFEFTPFQSNPAVAKFNLKGLTSHIDEVEQVCGRAGPLLRGTVRRAKAPETAADAALRAKISEYVHLCDPAGPFGGFSDPKWCWTWTHPDGTGTEKAADTRDQALNDAFEWAKSDPAFRAEISTGRRQ